jgi:small subunit ribosomal protein S6
MAKKQKQQLYEGMYILSATLSEDARQKALEKITGGILERTGEVHKVFEQGRRKLAYEINGRREGYYYIIYFTISSPSIAEMWKDYHLNEDLIRFLTLRTETVPEKIEFKALIQE